MKEADPDENTSDLDKLSYSYCMFFMGLMDERLTFETEGEVSDEEGVIQSFEGTGKVGCAFGISLLAPFAIITLDNIEYYKDGTQGLPSVEPHIFNMNGEAIDMDEHFREMYEDQELKVLYALSDKIKSVLESLGITVLPKEQLLKPAPWLQAGNGVLTAREITVRNTFFHCLYSTVTSSCCFIVC